MGGLTQIDAKGALYCNNGDLVLAAAIKGAGIISMPDFIVWDSVKEVGLSRHSKTMYFRRLAHTRSTRRPDTCL